MNTPPCQHCGQPLEKTGHGRKYHPLCAPLAKRKADRNAIAAKRDTGQGICKICGRKGELPLNDDWPTDWRSPYNKTPGRYCTLWCLAKALEKREPFEMTRFGREVLKARREGILPMRLPPAPKDLKGGDVLKARKAVFTGSLSTAMGEDEEAIMRWLLNGKRNRKTSRNNIPGGDKGVTRH